MTIQKKLLVLVDGSERSTQTVNYIKNIMPINEHTRIVLFHVLAGIPEEYRELKMDPNPVSDLSQLKNWEIAEKIKIEAYLEQAKKDLINSGVSEQSIEIKLHCLEKGVAQDIIDE